MAQGASYATLPDYLQRFTNKTGAADGPRIERALATVSRWIEARTNRFYNIDASVVARIFVGDGKGCLRLTDDPNNPLCPGIATSVGLIVKLDTALDLTYGTTLVLGTDFELSPASAALGPEARPYTELNMLAGYGVSSSLYSAWWAKYRVQVTAKFGYLTVPATIRDGCVELAGILLGDSPLATRQFTDIGTVGASTEARGIVRDMIDIHGPGIVVA